MKKWLAITIVVLSLTTFPMVVSATSTTTSPTAPTIYQPSTLPGPDSTKVVGNEATRNYFLNKFAPTYIGGFIGMMGGITFLMVVISGIQYLTSYGNDEKMKQATKSLTFSVIGLLLALLAWSIVSIVSNISFGGQADRSVGSGAATQSTDFKQVQKTQ